MKLRVRCQLVELLNEIGARNAIGRIDLVENRFVGMKSRGCYETPGGTLIIAAHRELEALTLDRECRTTSSTLPCVMPIWSTTACGSRLCARLFDAFVQKTQENVTGTVTLSLYKGNVNIVSRASRCLSIRPTSRRSPWATATIRRTQGLHPDPRPACTHPRSALLQKQKEVVK